MVLVGIIEVVDEDEVGIDLIDGRFDLLNQLPVQGQLGVLVAPPENLLAAEDLGSGFLLGTADFTIAPGAPLSSSLCRIC